jgi:hypothetical protein
MWAPISNNENRVYLVLLITLLFYSTVVYKYIMADRDSANIRHFKSRSQQPKILTGGGSVNLPDAVPSPVNVAIVFDSDFSSVTDDMESTKFRYIGVPSYYAGGTSYCATRNKYESMRSGFQY